MSLIIFAKMLNPETIWEFFCTHAILEAWVHKMKADKVIPIWWLSWVGNLRAISIGSFSMIVESQLQKFFSRHIHTVVAVPIIQKNLFRPTTLYGHDVDSWQYSPFSHLGQLILSTTWLSGSHKQKWGLYESCGHTDILCRRKKWRLVGKPKCLISFYIFHFYTFWLC